jgi:hypothetical protein
MKAILSLGIILFGAAASVALAEQDAKGTLSAVRLEKPQLDSITAAGSQEISKAQAVIVTVTNVNGKVTKNVKVIKDKKVIEREVIGPIKHIAKRRAEIAKLRANRLAEIKERLADRILARVNQTLKLVK